MFRKIRNRPFHSCLHSALDYKLILCMRLEVTKVTNHPIFHMQLASECNSVIFNILKITY